MICKFTKNTSLIFHQASIKSAQRRHFEKCPFYFRLVVQRWSKVQNHPHFQLELCTVYM